MFNTLELKEKAINLLIQKIKTYKYMKFSSLHNSEIL